MSFLLDTDVLSESQKPRPHTRVSAWLAAARSADLHISVLSLGELGRGVTKLRERGDTAQAARYEHWLAAALDRYDGRIIPVSLEVARVWGRQSMRRSPATVDALIAATAVVHSLTVVTRNARHVSLTGVRIVDPYDG